MEVKELLTKKIIFYQILTYSAVYCQRMKIYDCLIIGGGPAGLSAAIYLARFMRSLLVIDKKQGRSTFAQVTENYLGFPKGIPAIEFRKLGQEQAERFGARFVKDEVVSATKKTDGTFRVKGEKETYYGRTLLLATGVTDLFPTFPHFKQYIGKSLYWCITCDGYKTRDKRVVVVGHNDEAVVTCLQFLNYTDKLMFVSNCAKQKCEISGEKYNRLKKANIPVYYGIIQKVQGKKGYMKAVILDDETKLEADFMFNQQGSVPNSKLAKQLGLKTNEQGYIRIELEQRTSLSGVYAAGDVTRYFSHQVITAAHEGSMAAQAINYDLYPPEMKM